MDLYLVECPRHPDRFRVVVNHAQVGTLFIDHTGGKYDLRLDGRAPSSLHEVVRRVLPYDLQPVSAMRFAFARRERQDEPDAAPTGEAGFTAGMTKPRHAPEGNRCRHTMVMDQASADKLREMCKDVFFMEGKKKVGKEFFGRLEVTPQGDVLRLTYDADKVIAGDKDGIDGFEDKVTYHTHPYPTYIDFDAKYAWPSKTDYKSILETFAHGDGVIHIVVGVEGIYIVSLGDYWCDNIPELRKFVKAKDKSYRFLMKELDAEYPYSKKKKKVEFNTPHEFIKHANSQGINGKQVLITQFVPWDQVTKPFVVRSATERGGGCKL